MLEIIINEIDRNYEVLKKLNPNHKLLKYISFDDEGIIMPSERFEERFGYGDKTNINSFKDFRKILFTLYSNYSDVLKEAIAMINPSKSQLR